MSAPATLEGLDHVNGRLEAPAGRDVGDVYLTVDTITPEGVP
jgi:hypothetical protein